MHSAHFYRTENEGEVLPHVAIGGCVVRELFVPANITMLELRAKVDDIAAQVRAEFGSAVKCRVVLRYGSKAE